MMVAATLVEAPERAKILTRAPEFRRRKGALGRQRRRPVRHSFSVSAMFLEATREVGAASWCVTRIRYRPTARQRIGRATVLNSSKTNRLRVAHRLFGSLAPPRLGYLHSVPEGQGTHPRETGSVN
jgi:hypothetical protein